MKQERPRGSLLSGRAVEPAQQRLDFDRPRQNHLLRSLWLPDSKRILPSGKRVSLATIKTVLRAIADYGSGRECWPSEETLAATCGLSRGTVSRALHVLKANSLVICQLKRTENGKAVVNHYRVVWSEVAVLPTKPKDRCAPNASTDVRQSSDRCAPVSQKALSEALDEATDSDHIDSCLKEEPEDPILESILKVVPVGTPADLMFLQDVANMVADRQLSENDLRDALTATRLNGRDPGSYFRRCLQNAQAKAGGDFERAWQEYRSGAPAAHWRGV